MDKINENEVENIIERLNRSIEDAIKYKASLKSEPPKLRHGDYGYDEQNTPMVAGNLNLGPYCRFDTQEKYHPDYNPIPIHIGNIFDDLAAMREDVEGINLDKLHIGTNNHRDKICFVVSGHYSWHEIDKAEQIHRKLGAMIFNLKKEQATAKRKGGK